MEIFTPNFQNEPAPLIINFKLKKLYIGICIGYHYCHMPHISWFRMGAEVERKPARQPASQPASQQASQPASKGESQPKLLKDRSLKPLKQACPRFRLLFFRAMPT